MRLEQLNSLTEDEIAVLWYCINKIDPVLDGVDLDPATFTTIDHRKLMDILTNSRVHIKDEHLPLFDGLVAKLRV